MALSPHLHPSIQAFLAGFADTPLPPIDTLGAATLRQLFDQPLPVTPVAVAECRDLTIPGTGSALPARLYRPGPNCNRLTLFFHGGGFVMGTLDTHDNLCRHLCRELNTAVISVAYRLAPEHPYPAAPEDCYAATCWVAEHRAEFANANAKLLVAGDSAGACLSAAVCLLSRERGGPQIDAQLLFYPTVKPPQDNESYTTLGGGEYFLSRKQMAFFWRSYLPVQAPRLPPVAAPGLTTDLSDLPPAHIVLAEFDPLKDEGRDFAEQLEAAGNPVHLQAAPGMIHGFMSMPGVDEEVRAILQSIDAKLPS